VSADGTSLTCLTGASPTQESRSIYVQNYDGQFNASVINFQYRFPQVNITGVEPNNGPLAGNTLITIRGTNFRPEQHIFLTNQNRHPVNCLDIQWISSSEMRCKTPAYPLPQSLDVLVAREHFGAQTFSPDQARLSGAFTYLPQPPQINSVSPAQGRAGDILQIEGSDFYIRDLHPLTVRLGNVPCLVQQVSSTSIRCQIGEINPESPAGVSVVVMNPNGQRSVLENGFHFLPPLPATIASASPQNGTKNGDTLILIRGRNFRSGVQVKIAGANCNHVVRRESTISCITTSNRAAVGTPATIEIINPGAQPIQMAGAYTYQNIRRDPFTLDQLREDNHWGGTNPSDVEEVNQIQRTIRLRRESGNPVFGRYYLDVIAAGLRVAQSVRAFSVQGSDTIEQLKREYLASPEVAAIPFENLRNYIRLVFPNGRVLPENAPLFLNWTQLVYFPEDGIPRQVADSEIRSIQIANQAIDTLINYSTSISTSGWILNLKYQVKRILVDLNTNPSPDNIKKAIVVITAVGNACGPGNLEGIVTLARMFFNGRTLHVNLREPVTIEELILHRLDQKREEIFEIASSFDGDTQTSHTKNHFRQLVQADLQIAPGFIDPFSNAARFTHITREQFLNHFFRGKVGDPTRAGEDRRSHIGYTAREIAKTLIEFFHLNRATPQYAPELKAYFTSGTTTQQAQDWLTHLDNAGLTRQAAIAYTDCNTSTPATRQACIQELRDFYQGQDQALKEAMINKLYFEQRGAHFFLTEKGIRELLLRIRVLEPNG
jgi:hypothetical protein